MSEGSLQGQCGGWTEDADLGADSGRDTTVTVHTDRMSAGTSVLTAGKKPQLVGKSSFLQFSIYFFGGGDPE